MRPNTRQPRIFLKREQRGQLRRFTLSTDRPVQGFRLRTPSNHPQDFQPETWSPPLRARVAPVLAVLGQIRARRRLQLLVSRLLVWLTVALTLTAPFLLAMRLDAGRPPLLQILLAMGLVALIHALWQRHSWRQLAREVDAQILGKDLLPTALWLAQTGAVDGWAQVQAEAACRRANLLDARALQPWHLPRALPWLGGAFLLFLLAFYLPLSGVQRLTGQPSGLAHGLTLLLPGGPQPFTSAAALLGTDATKLLLADAGMLNEIEEQVTDPPTKAWLNQVKNVVAGVAEGKLDKRQALEQLAELEAQKPAAPQNPLDQEDVAPAGQGKGEKSPQEAQSPEQQAQAQELKDLAVKNAVAEAAKQAAKAAPKSSEQKELLEAAEKKDLGMLAKLAEKLANKDMSDKELEQWIKVAEKFADGLKNQKVPEKFKDLAERIDRLQKKREQEGGLGQSDQERLKSARRELDQLRRDQGDALAAEHQVQRLERGARQAADELRRAEDQDRLGKKDPQAKKTAQDELKKAMRAAANELRRENERQQDRQAQRAAGSRLRDLREALERSSAQRTAAQRQFEKKAGGQKGGQQQGEQEGENQQGKGEKEQQESAEARDAKRMAEARREKGEGKEGEGQKAGGQEKSGKFKLGQGKDGKFERMEAIREGYEQPQGQGGGKNPGDQKGNEQEGPETKRLAGGKREQLKGQQGSGPDTKKVFSDAAKKGFARQGWRDIYVEYSQVADDMLEQEQIPPGRRSVVRHYFELIRPRTGWAPQDGGK